MSVPLSARAAAELCGVDERTVRRWVKAGTLAADKRGGRFLIDRAALEPFIGHSDGQTNGHERTFAADRTERTVDDALVNLELVRLIDRLQRENRDLAGQLGYVQAKLQEAQLALEAPKPDSPEIDPRVDSVGPVVEPTPTSSDPRPSTPWWRRLMWSTT